MYVELAGEETRKETMDKHRYIFKPKVAKIDFKY